MIGYRGSQLRTPTLHLSGEYHVFRGDLGLFDDMIQRISTRIFLIHNNKPLLLRRADGRQSIFSKYELPGGRVFASEQPEDSLRRYLKDDIGITDNISIELQDAMTYVDSDDRDIQYAIITYRAVMPNAKRAIRLSQHYNKYLWYKVGSPDPEYLTNLTQILLGAEVPSRSKDLSRVATPLIYTDGGSRGNPGPSAAGFVLVDENGTVVEQGGEFLGITTNNQAEYQGVKNGLEAALAYGWRSVECRVDSMLVVNQLNGVYTIKNRELWPIHDNIKDLISQFEKIKFVHIPRELNQLADGVVNKTLDEENRERYTIK